MAKPPRQITRVALSVAMSVAMIGCNEKTPSADTEPTSQGLAPQGGVDVLNVKNTEAKEAKDISFNRDIRPILSENCFFCHGPDRKHQEADLRLDLFDAATRDLGGYSAIVPGDREASETWLRIVDKGDPMPPKKSHKKLTPEEIELIGAWIDQGAEYETHWSYTPVAEVDPPDDLKDQAWPINAIDHFILAELERRGIAPSPQAGPSTLLRRVTYDLTGLPPTPEQIKAFMSDPSPNAYENYVDSLLANETYGEHLAVWWLDLVRFADTIGIHSDNPRSVWPYRDWVIHAFNDNMPFDRFTTMQLAGDLMQDEPTKGMLTATAYNRLSIQTEEGGAQPKEYETIYTTDRVSNYSDVWLGSSVACAQCHDHKFDPFTIDDFYTLGAFFADVSNAVIANDKGYGKHKAPILFLPENEEQAQRVAEAQTAYDALLEAHPDAIRAEERMSSKRPQPPFPKGWTQEQIKEMRGLIGNRRKLANEVPYVVITQPRDVPRTVRVLARGNWQDESGAVVQPATPTFLGGPASDEGNRLTRLDLAKWTVSPDNPLTARVVANRLWGRYMGSAISSNTVELGSQGAPPTHPELLDWLASEFRSSGWDLKQTIRTIVTSKTYKQSADAREDLATIDPNNTRLFARQSAIRLPAEVIRDKALAVSGLLKPRVGGRSVFPYQPEGHWEPINFPKRSWPTSTGDDLYRRSLYTWVQRTFPHPMMVTFDAPSRETCTGQRMVSNTPLQALITLNGPTFVEAARVLAAQLVTQEQAEADRLDRLFELVLARKPRDTERDMLTELIHKQRQRFDDAPELAAKLIATGQAPVAEQLDPAELAAWTSACRVVLNLHEAVTRN